MHGYLIDYIVVKNMDVTHKTKVPHGDIGQVTPGPVVLGTLGAWMGSVTWLTAIQSMAMAFAQ